MARATMRALIADVRAAKKESISCSSHCTKRPYSLNRPTSPLNPTSQAYLHVDIKYLPQMADETARSYLFVAIDRATRWVFIQIMPSKSAANAPKFLKALHKACPIKIKHILIELIAKLKNHSNRPRSLGQILPKFARSDIH